MNKFKLTLAALALFAAVPASADEIDTFVKDGLALGGTDPVAYFTKGAAVAGDPKFETEWNGVKWRFSSEDNRAAFLAEPAKYAPQYGGYCATGASFGKKVATAPDQFKIVGGKLYLNSSSQAQSMFVGDEPGTISKADANWSKIEKVPADKL
jgi:YHS domain-containing protein